MEDVTAIEPIGGAAPQQSGEPHEYGIGDGFSDTCLAGAVA